LAPEGPTSSILSPEKRLMTSPLMVEYPVLTRSPSPVSSVPCYRAVQFHQPGNVRGSIDFDRVRYDREG
jgi:hypothetical protein